MCGYKNHRSNLSFLRDKSATSLSKLKSILVNPNPYPNKDCRMLLCPFCKSTSVSQPKDAKKIPCNTPGVGYQIDCKGCQENGLQTAYFGETGRPAVNRGIEHIKAIQSKKENHPIVKHLKQTTTIHRKGSLLSLPSLESSKLPWPDKQMRL